MFHLSTERTKHWFRLLVDSDYRYQRNETVRLQKFPRYKTTSTQLLGNRLELIDAESFLFTYSEIFRREIYKFSAGSPSPFIVDCGANIGLSVVYFKTLYPGSRITAFEPDPDIFQTLQRNCESFGFGDVQLIEKAVWINDSLVDFVSDKAEKGHLMRALNREKSIKVSGCRLKDFLQGEPVDFLKIDIEGAETEVLKDCVEELSNVRCLFVEYHSFAEEQQTLHELVTVLANAGFRLNLEPLNIDLHPFLSTRIKTGMDVQLNLFATR